MFELLERTLASNIRSKGLKTVVSSYLKKTSFRSKLVPNIFPKGSKNLIVIYFICDQIYILLYFLFTETVVTYYNSLFLFFSFYTLQLALTYHSNHTHTHTSFTLHNTFIVAYMTNFFFLTQHWDIHFILVFFSSFTHTFHSHLSGPAILFPSFWFSSNSDVECERRGRKSKKFLLLWCVKSIII